MCCSFCSFNLVYDKHASLPPKQQQPILSRQRVTLCMWGKKRHLVSWGDASVHTGFPEIPSLSSFQEDVTLKYRVQRTISHPVLTDAPGKSLHTYNIYIHILVKLCLPCWYLFICLNLIWFGRWMMEDSLEHLIGKKLISLTYFPSVLNKGIQTNIECTPRMTNQCVHMLFMMVLFIYSSALVQRHHLVLEDW